MKRIYYIAAILVLVNCMMAVLSACNCLEHQKTEIEMTLDDTKVPESTFFDDEIKLPIIKNFPDLNEETALKSAKLYKFPFETWPLEDDGVWNARAFFTMNLELDPCEGDFTENIGNDSYEYTWQLYVKINYTVSGPYAVKPIDSFCKDDGKTVYRLSIGDTPEGEFIKTIAKNDRCTFLVTISKNGESLCHCEIAHIWDFADRGHSNVYINYWSNHNRDEGYTSGSHPVTEDDEKYADEQGFGILPYNQISGKFVQLLTWPFYDDGTWSARAFYDLCIKIDSSKGIFAQNAGTEDYPYTWMIYYYNEKDRPESFLELNGPYIVSLYTEDTVWNERNIYHLSVGDCPQGDFTLNFEVGETYWLYIFIKKGNMFVGYIYLSAGWEWYNISSAIRDLYHAYWERHDRDLGITSGIHKVTDDDNKDAEELGFNENGKYTLPIIPDS